MSDDEPLVLDVHIDPLAISPARLAALQSYALQYQQHFKSDTLYKSLYAYFGEYAARPFLGTIVDGAIAYRTYTDVWLEAQAFGSGLLNLMEYDPETADKKNQYFLSMCSQNRAEWAVADLAACFYGYVTVPLHVSLPHDHMSYILSHSDVHAILCTLDMVDALLAAASDPARPCTRLRHVILMRDAGASSASDRLLQSAYEAAERHGLAGRLVFSVYEDVLALGNAQYFDHVAVDGDTLLTLIYTSGSTGVPKGAVMTHHRWNVFMTAPCLMPFPLINLSFAPLAHVAERQSIYLVVGFGGAIVFFSGDMARIFDDLALVRPTSLSAVPRFFNKIFTEYKAALQTALAAAGPAADRRAIEQATMASFAGILGGRTQYLVTGSAPTSEEVKAFIRKLFPVTLYDGYGLTETGGVSVDNMISADVDVILEDVPGLYTKLDKPYPRGEICVKTKHLIDGYYKNEAATADAFTEAGYFRTGDIGVLEADGCVRIIDRKKAAFKLANGEFVAPEPIELRFLASSLVDQIFVYGDPTRTCLVAVVVPNFVTLAAALAASQDPAARALDLRALDEAQLAASVPIQNLLLAELHACAAKARMPRYEVPLALHVERNQFTSENGLMTYSNKVARPQLKEHYAAVLEAMYDRLNLEGTAPVALGAEGALAQLVQQVLGREASGGNASLAALGLDSMSAVRLASAMRERFARDVALESILAADSLEALTAQLGGSPDSEGVDGVRALVQQDLLLALPERFDAGADASASDCRAGAPGRPRKVLVTGATGFIGRTLLGLLLRAYRSSTQFVCLVRARDDVAARTRLLAALDAAGIVLQPDEADSARLLVLAADVADEAELSAVLRDERCADADLIVHSAAVVNWIKPYRELRKTNVLATQALLRFAAERSGRFMLFVSTIGVAIAHEDDMQPLDNMLASSAYGLSKWVAEKLVVRATAAGLACAIVRPGLVSGDTVLGIGNPTDFVCRYLAGCLAMGAYIDDSEALLDLTPVDFVARVCLSVVEHASEAASGTVYHVSNTAHSYSYAQIGRALASLEPGLRALPYRAWVGLLREQSNAQLMPLIDSFPLDRFIMRYPILGTAHVDVLLARDKLSWPQVDDDLIRRYAAWLRAASPAAASSAAP